MILNDAEIVVNGYRKLIDIGSEIFLEAEYLSNLKRQKDHPSTDLIEFINKLKESISIHTPEYYENLLKIATKTVMEIVSILKMSNQPPTGRYLFELQRDTNEIALILQDILYTPDHEFKSNESKMGFMKECGNLVYETWKSWPNTSLNTGKFLQKQIKNWVTIGVWRN